jgi:hypothetical protein
MPLIYAIGIAVAAQLLIYSGLTFMVGKLLPTLLTPVYDLVPPGNYRFLVSSATVILREITYFSAYIHGNRY